MAERDSMVSDEESEGGDGYVLLDTETPEPAVTSKSTLGAQPLHIMLASFVGSLGIVFGVIPILVSYQNFEHIIPYIGRTVCSMVLLSLSTFFIVWRSRGAITEDRCTELSAKALLKILKEFSGFVVYHCPAIVQILVFATGSIASCVLDIYNNSKDMKDDHTYKSIFIVEDTFRILSLASQTVFYSWFMYDRPRQLPCGYYAAIALMIGAEAWLWISDTTEPLWTLGQKYTEIYKMDENSPFTENWEQKSLFLQDFLEPFHVEFSTISFGLLYELWSFRPDKKFRKKALTHPSVLVSRTHKIISAFLFVLYASVSTVILFAKCPKCDLNPVIVFLRLMIYKGFLFLLYGLFLLTVTSIALFPITSTNKKSSDTGLSQCLLLVTAIITFVFYILRIFAAGYDLRSDEYQHNHNVSFVSYRSVTLQKYRMKIPTNITYSEQVGMDGVMFTYPFFMIFQVWVQTQFLIVAQCHKELPRFVQVALVYIIMMNFAEWLQTGISLGFDRDEGKSDHTTPIMDEFFTDEGGRIIRLCLYPFMILYRFHSAVVAWEILIENGIEEDDSRIENGIEEDDSREHGVAEEIEGHRNSLSINSDTSVELVD